MNEKGSMLYQAVNKTAITTNAQQRNLNGIDYAVYPCVLLVQGVHHGIGSDPVFYSQNILRESAPFWNNVPVTIGHPVVNGIHVMCNNDGTIRQQYQVGYVSNARYEDGKLKGDLLINTSQVAEKSPGLLSFLEMGGELEVSTGLLAGEDGVAGTWNEETYNSSILEIIPDHLALLPGSTGACSWDDGCGVRVNANKESKIIICEADLRQNLEKIHRYVDSIDTHRRIGNDQREYIKINHVRAVYSKYFIYECQDKSNNTQKLFKQDYTINGNSELVMEQDPVEVVENITYKAVNNSHINSNKGENVMADKSNGTCCPKKVEALITNADNSFTNEDQPWLESLEEIQLDKLVANSTPVVEEEEVEEVEPTEKEITLQSYLEQAPTEVRSLLNDGLKELDNKRNQLITRITANEGNTFNADQLKEMDTQMLQSISALIPEKKEVEPVSNFGMTFPAITNTQNEEEVEAYVPTTLSSVLGKKADK